MNTKLAKGLRKQLIHPELLKIAREASPGVRVTRGSVMRDSRRYTAKTYRKSTEFRGRLIWIVRETDPSGIFSLNARFVRGGSAAQAIEKARMWAGTYAYADPVVTVNGGALAVDCFRAIYQRAKRVVNGYVPKAKEPVNAVASNP